jgi:hypothetical protein
VAKEDLDCFENQKYQNNFTQPLPLQVLINIRSNHMKEKISHFNEAGFLLPFLEVIHPK